MKKLLLIMLTSLLILSGCSGNFDFEENEFENGIELTGNAQVDEEKFDAQVRVEEEEDKVKISGNVNIDGEEYEGSIVIEDNKEIALFDIKDPDYCNQYETELSCGTEYEIDERSFSVSLRTFNEQSLLEHELKNTLNLYERDSVDNIKKINLNGNFVYTFLDTPNFYVWSSGNMLITVSGENSLTLELVLIYLKKYPSYTEDVVDTSNEEFCHYDEDYRSELCLQQKITYLDGVQSEFVQDETIKIYAKTLEKDGTIAKRDEGWHIQYYTYKVDDDNSYLSEYISEGAYNANFNEQTNLWEMKYWAPRVPGKYYTDFTLYCSRIDSKCQEYPDYGWKEKMYFEVLCKDESCSYELDEIDAVKVTKDGGGAGDSNIIKLENGDLFVAFDGTSGDEHGYFYSISKDNGKTWEDQKYLLDGWSSIDLFQGSNRNILALSRASEKGISVYEINLDLNEIHETIVPDTTYNYAVGSLFEEGYKGGEQRYLYVSYSDYNENDGMDTDVYITKTDILSSEEWSGDTIRVTYDKGADFDSSLLESSNGNFYMAHNSYSRGGVVITTSPNGDSWNQTYLIDTKTNAHVGVNMLEIDSIPVVFFGGYGNLYYSYLIDKDELKFSEPIMILEDIPFGASAVDLGNGEIGVTFVKDLNNNRDIFFKNIGKLNFN